MSQASRIKLRSKSGGKSSVRALVWAASVVLSGPAGAVVVVEDPVTEANTLQSTIHQAKSIANQIQIINNQIAQLIQIKNTVEAVAHGDLAALSQLSPELAGIGITLPFGDALSTAQAMSGLVIGTVANVAGQAGATVSLSRELMRTDQFYAPAPIDLQSIIMNQTAASVAAAKAAATLSLQANDQRIQSLNTLRTAIGPNKDLKAAADATARLAGEQATAQAQTNQILSLMMLREAQRDTQAAQEQQLVRCSADKFLASARASIAASAGGTVALVTPSISSVDCRPQAVQTMAQISPGISDATGGSLVTANVAATPISTGGLNGTALGTMLATSWGQMAANNASALGISPAALAATCVLESNCTANPGGTGTISGAFQMSDGTFAQTVGEVASSNPALASQITAKNDPASQSIAASQYLLDGARTLMQAGISNPTSLDVRGFYQFGPANGAYLASAPDNQLMVETLTGLSARTLAANNITPTTTVGQWRAGVVSKIGAAASQPVLLGVSST